MPLARGEWVTAPDDVIFAGPIGTGEAHLAIGLGVEPTNHRRRGLFTRGVNLVRQLLKARNVASSPECSIVCCASTYSSWTCRIRAA